MKIKTYDSRTCEVKIKESKLSLTVSETNLVELDFNSNVHCVKKYPKSPLVHKKKWFSRPSLSDVLLGAVFSTLLGFCVQYFFIGI